MLHLAISVIGGAIGGGAVGFFTTRRRQRRLRRLRFPDLKPGDLRRELGDLPLSDLKTSQRRRDGH